MQLETVLESLEILNELKKRTLQELAEDPVLRGAVL